MHESSLLGIFFGVDFKNAITFAKFAVPRAKVIFSKVAIVKKFNTKPTLMFRIANERLNQILQAEIMVTLLLREVSKEGEVMRRFYDLKMVRSSTPVFALSWTVTL